MKSNGKYFVRHGEGEEIVDAADDAAFIEWAKGRVQETTQVVLATFLASALTQNGNSVNGLNAHSGKQITLDLAGDWRASKSQLRVK